MDVITAIEPTLQVSFLFGLSTFDKALNRTVKLRLYSWLIFSLNLILQFSDTYYFIEVDLKGNLNDVITKHPHDSTLITLNCFLTTFVILVYDGMINEALAKLREFNKNRFPMDQRNLTYLRNISRFLSNGCVFFCVSFVGTSTVWCWYMEISQNLGEYLIYCSGIFARYSTYGILSNQVVSYLMVIWLWYHTINELMRRLNGDTQKDRKNKLRILIDADSLIKDFNKDLSFVYAIFILLSCATALFEGIHTVVFFVYHPKVEIYEVVLTLFFVTSLIIQIGLLAGISASIDNKVRKTAHYVSDLFVDDAELKEEVEIFSLQLLQRDVELTACGLFKLDVPLLCKMAGSVMTYIVTVFQLHTFSVPKTKSELLNGKNC